MKQRTERIFVAALALLPVTAWAQQAAPAPAAPIEVAAKAPAAPAPSSSLSQTKDQLTRMPSAADLRPNGPVTIGANHAELVQGNAATYVGNVTLDSDTLKMDGDRLELKRAADGQYTAKITGSPAHMAHAGNGPDNPPVSAHAKTMIYDSRAGTIDLVGDALMTRGDDKTTAETIRYHVLEQRYEASGGDGSNGNPGRVMIVIPPVAPPPATTAPPAAPPPASPVQPNAAPTGTAPPAAAPVVKPPGPPAADGTQSAPKP